MKNIIKSLISGDGVTLSVEQAKRLHDYIGRLEKRAAQGDEYVESLKSEVLRLSCAAQPGISKDTMESALSGLSVKQLKEFMEVYKTKAEKKFLPKPQLAGALHTASTEGNKEFKI